ncbi:MAG: 3,4-dihydroxy-2-butanone-4-phosphate synthase [Elusimicrobiota bacterium]|jgi:3,4-dihydroxy 2-butanone 4-phosphate synthase/GTP cyclohydrolase II|nr:3,4-dihydroxy-2-butanone-4-phosphate synthase [Elusimicrobiota bacterium]
MKKNNIFVSPSEAAKELKEGKMIIAVDAPDRENEGDLICAASKITAQHVNFMTKYGRGLVCVSMEDARLKELNLENMTANSTEKRGCCFTVSVDYAHGTTTGISAYDRALTIQKLADKTAKAKDFLRPGHIFPLRSQKGGVLKRTGHTEAVTDLVKMAGLEPAGALCEIMNEDGTMAKVPNLIKFAKKHKLKIITIEDLVKYRRINNEQIKEIVKVDFPTKYGNFKLHLFEDSITGESHIAIVKGIVKDKENVLIRLHSSCETGDVFHSLRCDCGQQLEYAMQRVQEQGCGVILYMHQEGRGIGLTNKLKAYLLQDKGLDTVDANIALGFAPDLRDYSFSAGMLNLLQIKSVRIMTNNPEKIEELIKCNIKVSQRVPIEIAPSKSNKQYLKTKKNKMRHILKEV